MCREGMWAKHMYRIAALARAHHVVASSRGDSDLVASVDSPALRLWLLSPTVEIVLEFLERLCVGVGYTGEVTLQIRDRALFVVNDVLP